MLSAEKKIWQILCIHFQNTPWNADATYSIIWKKNIEKIFKLQIDISILLDQIIVDKK